MKYVNIATVRGFPFIDTEHAETEAQEEWLGSMPDDMRQWFADHGLTPEIRTDQLGLEFEDGEVTLPIEISVAFRDPSMAVLFKLTFGGQ